MLLDLLSINWRGAAVIEVFFILGLWKIFVKCEKKGWWALIPGFREFQLAKCVDREDDGGKFCVVSVLFYISYIANRLAVGEDGMYNVGIMFQLILLIAISTFVIAQFVYTIRIFIGLFELFGVSKKWLWLYFLLGKPVPLLILGFSKKYRPSVIYITDKNKLGAAVSGVNVTAMEEGLTVNIQERTAGNLFKKKTLLKDIHLNIEPGHMVLLLGGSGAGKTTFLNAVNGYEKAKADIILNGTNVYKEYNKMKYRVGFVPQMDLMRGNDGVDVTLRDAAKLRLPSKMPKEKRNKRIDETLDFFGLEPVKDRLCDKLSGGQRKRLSIAMEYISNPDLFILDEPDSGLDGVMARELMEGLRKIADEGKIIIVITHSPDRVLDLFDDVIVLAKDSLLTGRLAYYGPVEEAKKFFERDSMEKVVLRVNRKEEGGEGLADSFIEKYVEVCNG
ncbi:MAG: ATP-binding cassette domain-containing protein [Eubacterium sp.]|nr:ATP-binding cassette domain-containing protein [Eubacterium sp.]